MKKRKISFRAGHIRNLSDYIKAVVKLTGLFDERQKLWFRGHADSSFSLVPSLYREVLTKQAERAPYVLRPDAIYNVERGIDLSFSRQATTFLSKNGIRNTQMNRYFLKQHYKVKTRLLDWTESSLVALYFAISDSNFMSTEAEIKVLLPAFLNNFAIQTLAKDTSREAIYIFYPVDEFDPKDDLFTERGTIRLNQLFRKYYQLDVAKDEEMFPIAIYPPYLDDRMRAQQSCFTLFGNMYNGLEDAGAASEFLFSIKIPAASKAVILKELRLLGFNEFSVYPDLDGLGHAINNEYKLRFADETFAEHSAMMEYILKEFFDMRPMDTNPEEENGKDSGQ